MRSINTQRRLNRVETVGMPWNSHLHTTRKQPQQAPSNDHHRQQTTCNKTTKQQNNKLRTPCTGRLETRPPPSAAVITTRESRMTTEVRLAVINTQTSHPQNYGHLHSRVQVPTTWCVLVKTKQSSTTHPRSSGQKSWPSATAHLQEHPSSPRPPRKSTLPNFTRRRIPCGASYVDHYGVFELWLETHHAAMHKSTSKHVGLVVSRQWSVTTPPGKQQNPGMNGNQQCSKFAQKQSRKQKTTATSSHWAWAQASAEQRDEDDDRPTRRQRLNSENGMLRNTGRDGNFKLELKRPILTLPLWFRACVSGVSSDVCAVASCK